MSARAWATRARSRAIRTIRAPCRANSVAATWPMPDVPPVITTTLPSIMRLPSRRRPRRVDPCLRRPRHARQFGEDAFGGVQPGVGGFPFALDQHGLVGAETPQHRVLLDIGDQGRRVGEIV